MKILAVDYGMARTGLAECDVMQTIATPIRSVPSWDEQKLLDEICAVVKDHRIELIVVGRPLRTDGQSSDMASKAEAFAQKLKELTGKPVDMLDERFTTVIASKRLHENAHKAKDQRSVIDAAAAAVLLEDYIRTH